MSTFIINLIINRKTSFEYISNLSVDCTRRDTRRRPKEYFLAERQLMSGTIKFNLSEESLLDVAIT